MLSTIDVVEFEVLRITSAPPSAARLFPSRTISSASEIPDHLVFVGGMRNCDGFETCGLRILHCQVSQAGNPEHGHALVRLRIGPAEPTIDRVTRTEDRGCLLIGNLVGNKVGCLGIHQQVLGMSALCLNRCILQIGTKHSAYTL